MRLQDIPELVEQQGEEEEAAAEPVEEEFDLADIMKARMFEAVFDKTGVASTTP